MDAPPTALFLALVSASPGMGHAPQGPEPLELDPGAVICLLGNATAERMQHHGWLEVELHTRFPEHGLSVRNLGFGADEVGVHQRTMNFGKLPEDEMALTLENERFLPWDRYLDHCGADLVFAFFGFNESFSGEAGLPAFRRDLTRFVDHVGRTPYGGEPARLVLFSALPFEDHADPNLPDGALENRAIEGVNAAMAEVAARKGVRFVDLYAPMAERYAAAAEPLTLNGVHLTEEGNRQLAEVIAEALFPGRTPAGVDRTLLREAVLAKNLDWFHRYRATDGYNVYGGRSRMVYQAADDGEAFSNYEVLQREMAYLDAAAAHGDRLIAALASGGPPPPAPDLPALLPVRTNRAGGGAAGEHEFESGADALAHMTPAPGMRVELFADEADFPELANPVQMAFDTRGRLWVATWPTYTHWTPDQEMNDKLVILEDTDGDGRADRSTLFADDLHNPTGFEFWNGGVLLAGVPDLLFLEDTDGDDRADRTTRLLHGLSSADTHHSANSFVLGPDGALYFQEGTFHQSQLESPYGPVRNHNGCVWRFEPRTFRVERYIPYDFANPHGHVFDTFGQDFMTDGTGNVNYYALPFSGHLRHPDKHRSYFPFFKQRSRPAAATEILSSAHFPEENQGHYLIANVIGFQGIFQYEVQDQGSGFGAVETHPIVESSDPNFRPVDLEVGPDGALYFLDWQNPLIGHLQHHIRDPSRDAAHGRVYRVTAEGRPLLSPEPIAGRPIAELLELLRSPEDRVRYRVRIELSGRPSEAVVAAAKAWSAALPEGPARERLRLEALWLHQQHNRMDAALLEELLEASDPRVRAAAVRVLRYGRRHLENPLALLAPRAEDAHPRVRLEAVVAASFFGSARAAEIALAALGHPTDEFLDYALQETMRSLEPAWKEALQGGTSLAAGNPAGVSFLLERVEAAELASLPRTPAVLEAVLTRHGVSTEERARAAKEWAQLTGDGVGERLLAALQRVDAEGGAHAGHVAHDLFALLSVEVARGALAREALEPLTRAHRAQLRGLGYAALMLVDGSPEPTWSEALRSEAGLHAMLGGVASLPDVPLRAALAERVHAVARALPPGLDEESIGGAGSGLEVGFFEPAPENAERASLAHEPDVALWSEGISLDLEPAGESDSFGLTFRGSLHVAEAGRYEFSTNSDDGSRLYLGERCVVANDGPHGMQRREGAIQLAAGPHPLLVTYFEQGGAEGLEVEWRGPGFDWEPLPASVLGLGSGGSLRAAAIEALAQLPGSAGAWGERLADAALWLEEAELRAASRALVRAAPPGARTRAAVEPLIEGLLANLAALPPAMRTSPEAGSTLALARELADSLDSDQAAVVRTLLDQLGGTSIVVRTLPHEMRFDLEEFWVEAGEPVAIVFENNDVMPHNLVVTLPGHMQGVGLAAEDLDGGRANEHQFVPDHEGVLWFTRLLLPGESQRLSFVAPQEPGEHPYVCTYPGHWQVMNGRMHVVEELEEAPALVRRESGEAAAPVRAFVREWTLEELAPHFAEGWEAGRSVERGHEIFTAVGCHKCHTVGEEGAVGGPSLTAIGSKYRGLELLQHVLEPSLDVLEEYAFEGFELEGGQRVHGRVLSEAGEAVAVVEALLEPEVVTRVPKEAIVDRWELALSPMPTGLLVTCEAEEILDLVAFLQDAGRQGPREAEPAPSRSADQHPDRELWAVFEGGEGPGRGKHIVLLSGDDEYRSEEALPMLARILAERHGFRCTVLFATNPETGEIQPDFQTHIPGMHLLEEADMLVCFLRFRQLPDEDMKFFVDYVESGRPILGIRTATHAFHYRGESESPYRHYDFRSSEWPGGFGQQILGDTWINHHGHHGKESTRGAVEPANADHPILRGVEDVWGPTDVYGIRNLDEAATILLRGAVLAGMEPGDPPVDGPKNDPMIPLAWTRELERDGGPPQRIFCSTMGSSVDCESEDLRRLFVNACYWGLRMEDRIPARNPAGIVGSYEPTPFGFGAFVPGVNARDHEAR